MTDKSSAFSWFFWILRKWFCFWVFENISGSNSWSSKGKYFCYPGEKKTSWRSIFSQRGLIEINSWQLNLNKGYYKKFVTGGQWVFFLRWSKRNKKFVGFLPWLGLAEDVIHSKDRICWDLLVVWKEKNILAKIRIFFWNFETARLS